jgi:hypothetical protein
VGYTYKSFTDTRTWKLGLWPRKSQKMNICFKFSVLVLCSLSTLGAVLIPPWPEDVSVPEQAGGIYGSKPKGYPVRYCSYLP